MKQATGDPDFLCCVLCPVGDEPKHNWLVVLSILKHMKVNRKDYPIYYGNYPICIYIYIYIIPINIPYIMENIQHVPNHQPDISMSGMSLKSMFHIKAMRSLRCF